MAPTLIFHRAAQSGPRSEFSTLAMPHIRLTLQGWTAPAWRRFSPAQTRAAIIVCEFLLLAALAYVLAQIFWTVMHGPDGAGGSGATPPVIGQRAQDSAASQAGILTQIDVFYRQSGRQSAAAGPDGDVPPAPETALDLQLFGVRAGADSEQGSAIIRLPDGNQRSFMVGEELIDGVRLLHVLPDRVVIAHRGARESLAFADAKRKRAVTAVAAPASTAAVDPASLFQQIETRPRRIDGKLNGFLLYPKGNGATFRRLGLEAGDVLLAINDRPLGSFEALQEMPQRLAGLRRLRLTIERQGQNQTLNIGGDG